MMKMTRFGATLLGFVALSAMTTVFATAEHSEGGSMPGSQVKLYVLQCGMMDMLEWSYFEQIYGMKKADVAVPKQANPCFLVTHGDQSLLWDTGLPESLSGIPRLSQHGVYESMPVKLSDQLEVLGLGVDSLDYLALSHLHYDHVGNLELFPASTILLRAAERDGVYDEEGNLKLGYSQTTLDFIATAGDVKMLEGRYDVFGDGSVVLIPAPGHTPGSQIMLVRLKEYGNVVVSGDTAHFQEEFEENFASSLNQDKVQASDTLQMVRELLREEDARFWIQHDPVQYIGHKLAPAYYR